MEKIAIVVWILFASIAQAGDPPRAARSVHLHYPGPGGDLFYNEVTVEQSTPGSYFMACGFQHGYFGIQELDEGPKVVIFSVWDAEDKEAKALGKKTEAVVLQHAPDVRIRRFGGEGTGAQCMMDFDWKIGQTYRFAIAAKQSGETTAYAAYLYLDSTKTWKRLATFSTFTGKDGNMNGYYSFIEDFRRDQKSATEVRRARFGTGWSRALNGVWHPLGKARFTASNSEWEAKETIDAGTIDQSFYLQTGGETRTKTPLDSLMNQSPDGYERPDSPDDAIDKPATEP
jgi:hypothetical protein